jgi:hypothetical protein
MASNGKVTFYADSSGGTNYVKKWGPATTGANITRTAWLNIGFKNLSSVSKTMRMNGISVYDVDEVMTVVKQNSAGYPNVVSLPIGCTPLTTPDFYRSSYDGSIPCYVTPSDGLGFVVDASNFYKGSVRAYSSNNSQSTPRQVLGTDEIQDTDSFYITNGLIKLASTPPGVNFYAYSSPSWALLNTFRIGTGLLNVKVNDISPDHSTVQFNDTHWEIYRGKPYVYVSHPNTPLIYSVKQGYYADNTATITPSAGVSIPMLYNYYAIMYNDGDTIGTEIMQKYPTTIKTDSIPACELTGIGAFTIASTPPDVATGYKSLATQWVKRTETKARITRP